MRLHFAAAPFGAKEIGITDSNTKRPMLVKFPLSRSFGICKATALLHPAITAEQKFFGALGLRVQEEQIFCKKRQKHS